MVKRTILVLAAVVLLVLGAGELSSPASAQQAVSPCVRNSLGGCQSVTQDFGLTAASICDQTAQVNVTAGNTTQIVALTANETIRVCSVAISMSAAGTAKFVTGTGTNCATGTADVTPAMTLATGVPLTVSESDGLFAGAASGALCVAAATGNAVGFVTYTKF